MKIVRDGKEYELTSEELAAANTEFVTNFMKSEMMGRCEISDEELVTNFMRMTLETDFGVSPEDSQDLAEQAYDRYCEGNGETEGECVDWAYYSWLESTRKE